MSLEIFTGNADGHLIIPLPESIDLAISSAVEVYEELGSGYYESIYRIALALELRRQGVIVVEECTIDISYKDIPIGRGKVDLLLDYKYPVELKYVQRASDAYKAQCYGYMKSMKADFGLLISFASVFTAPFVQVDVLNLNGDLVHTERYTKTIIEED